MEASGETLGRGSILFFSSYFIIFQKKKKKPGHTHTMFVVSKESPV